MIYPMSGYSDALVYKARVGYTEERYTNKQYLNGRNPYSSLLASNPKFIKIGLIEDSVSSTFLRIDIALLTSLSFTALSNAVKRPLT